MQSGASLNKAIGEYRPVDFLGAGGMGEVYRAVHARTGRVVAIKTLNRASRNPNMAERFRNEASIQAQLWHPNIARLYDFVETGEQLCIIMEYVDGETLHHHIQAVGPLMFADTLAIFRPVVEAIAYLHDHEIVHRDIKSNNIKLTSKGEVKLLDFGIAKAGNSPQLTAMGDVIGTFEYLSPEQLTGSPADARSDIWALGVLLYEMVSGRVPFDATTIGRLVEQISKGEYQSPSQRNPGVPREIEAIIARCLKRNPAARYQTAHELLTDVRRAMTALNPPPAGSAIQTTTLPAPWLRNNWQTLTIAAMALTIVALLVILATSGGVSPPPQSSSAPAAAPNVAAPTPTAATAASAEMRSVRINTLEGRADVYRNSQMVGTTPYEITAPLGERVRLTLKRAGYEDELLDFVITENKKEYTITMKRP